MKKHLITAIAIALLAVGGYFGYTMQYGDSDLTELQLMNVEALTYNENPFLTTKTCFIYCVPVEGLDPCLAVRSCLHCDLVWAIKMDYPAECPRP